MLCDRRMPAKLKGKIYRTGIIPAILLWAETWVRIETQEKRIAVNEIGRLVAYVGPMCGVTTKDKIMNLRIRITTRVASRKITRRRLLWYGHVMRIYEEHILRDCCGRVYQGKGREEDR